MHLKIDTEVLNNTKGSCDLPYKSLVPRNKIYKDWFHQWAAEEYYNQTNNVTQYGNPLLYPGLSPNQYWILVSQTDFLSCCERIL